MHDPIGGNLSSGILGICNSTKCLLPNGWRYPLVGGTRQRLFDGTNLKPRKLPENAQTPTSRVHALLGALAECNLHWLTKTDIFIDHNLRCPTFESLF